MDASRPFALPTPGALLEPVTRRAQRVAGGALALSCLNLGCFLEDELAATDGGGRAGSGAAIRIEFDDPADWQWALDIWRSLAPG